MDPRVLDRVLPVLPFEDRSGLVSGEPARPCHLEGYGNDDLEFLRSSRSNSSCETAVVIDAAKSSDGRLVLEKRRTDVVSKV